MLAPYAGPSLYRNQGQRVVVGQRIMQTVPDMFLGWTEDRGDDQHCYVRHLKDSRLALIGARPGRGRAALSRDPVRRHPGAGACALGRCGADRGLYGHRRGVRCGDRGFRHGLCHADRADWRLFLEAIKAGLIEARAE